MCNDVLGGGGEGNTIIPYNFKHKIPPSILHNPISDFCRNAKKYRPMHSKFQL